MTKESTRRSAFSLIETAIVVLIIGVILAATLQAKTMIAKARLAKSIQLTKDSPLSNLSEVAFWFETTDPLSFKKNERENYLDLSAAEQSEGRGSITKWYDHNPHPDSRNDATAASKSQAPKFYLQCLNSTPCVHFDGSANYLTINNTSSMNLGDYTIFIVEKRSNTNSMPIIGSSSATTQDASLEIGYLDADTIYWNQGNSTYQRQYTTSDLNLNKPSIHTFINATNANGGTSVQEYYLNTNLIETSNPETSTTFTSTSFGSSLEIGRSVSSYYEGNISEVILIPFALSASQRIHIEKYLLEKWKISNDPIAATPDAEEEPIGEDPEDPIPDDLEIVS